MGSVLSPANTGDSLYTAPRSANNVKPLDVGFSSFGENIVNINSSKPAVDSLPL